MCVCCAHGWKRLMISHLLNQKSHVAKTSRPSRSLERINNRSVCEEHDASFPHFSIKWISIIKLESGIYFNWLCETQSPDKSLQDPTSPTPIHTFKNGYNRTISQMRNRAYFVVEWILWIRYRRSLARAAPVD